MNSAVLMWWYYLWFCCGCCRDKFMKNTSKLSWRLILEFSIWQYWLIFHVKSLSFVASIAIFMWKLLQSCSQSCSESKVPWNQSYSLTATRYKFFLNKVEKQQSKSIFVPKTKYYSKLVISVEGWPFSGCSLVSAPPCYYTGSPISDSLY